MNLLRALGWTLLIEAAVGAVVIATSMPAAQGNSAILLLGLLGFGIVTAWRRHNPDWVCWAFAFWGPIGVFIALWRSGNRTA